MKEKMTKFIKKNVYNFLFVFHISLKLLSNETDREDVIVDVVEEVVEQFVLDEIKRNKKDKKKDDKNDD